MKSLTNKTGTIVFIIIFLIAIGFGVQSQTTVYAGTEIRIAPDAIMQNGDSESLDTGGVEIFTERSLTKQTEKREQEEKDEETMLQGLFPQKASKQDADEEYKNIEIFNTENTYLQEDIQDKSAASLLKALIYIAYIVFVAWLVFVGIKISRKIRRKKA